jgi:hypothetical protein
MAAGLLASLRARSTLLLLVGLCSGLPAVLPPDLSRRSNESVPAPLSPALGNYTLEQLAESRQAEAFALPWLGFTDEDDVNKLRGDLAKLHPAGSFAPVRSGGHAKWFVDGHDYFCLCEERPKTL